MTRDSLLTEDWPGLVERLGGADALAASARETKAFRRGRVIKSAADLLRLVLAYCLGAQGLRSTTAWAAAIGLVDVSNVALLYRLQQCGDWLARLIGDVLAASASQASQGRPIRILDATTVPKAGRAAKRRNGLWRVHSAFELPHERFGYFALSDEHEAEQLDRVPVVPGEIRLGDGVYLQPDRLAAVLAQGGDVVVRAGWRSARWLDAAGQTVDLMAALDRAESGILDRPIGIARKGGSPALALRLVALRMPETAAARARRKARRQARKEGYQLSDAALRAAEWVILVTSLNTETFSTADVLALYRLRWRVELAFKRLKSVLGLHGPPGYVERSARPYVLAHLLMILLLEPLVDELEDSPRWAEAA
jgi:hypothetical protein